MFSQSLNRFLRSCFHIFGMSSFIRCCSKKRFGIGILALMAGATTCGEQVYAQRFSNNISIYNDHGGEIIAYALRVLETQQSGAVLSFRGSCDSACTLYLGLPNNQICISAGASFRFHLPFGSAAANNRIAANYMTASYPGWVNRWIRAHNGLSQNLITMDYSYANKFLRTCET